MPHAARKQVTLVVGGTGKTGRRVALRLDALGWPVRIGSRSSDTPFDWEDPDTWPGALEDVGAAYVTYSPDLAVPEAPPAIRAFAALAAKQGVERLVLLSGRGEEEAQRCERIVMETNPAWTVVRASWFQQNFSEAFFLEPLRRGALALPAGDVGEPFVDVEDIADVAVAALTEAGHEGRIYEVTGPRLLTFADAVGEIARASGRELRYEPVPVDAFVREMRALETPEAIVALTRYLFETVLDGRNAHVCDGVQRALGRPPRDFSDYARATAATGVWAEPPPPVTADGRRPDGPADHGPTMRRFVAEVLNGADLPALRELVHPDYVHRAPGEEIRGPDGLEALLSGLRSAFPDLEVGIDELLAFGDATLLSFTLSGTHRGALLGHPATGRRVEVHGMVRTRYRDGKIAEEWEILDRLALLEQLGLTRSDE